MLSSVNAIICTAAPYAYVSRINFNKKICIICALHPKNKLPDLPNYGAGKVENIKAFFKNENINVINIFTDNLNNDQPLVDYADHAFLVHGEHIEKIK